MTRSEPVPLLEPVPGEAVQGPGRGPVHGDDVGPSVYSSAMTAPPLADIVDPRNALGRRAEALAAERLAARGWELVDRNHRCKRGEVDLVCRDGAYVRFVEVRSRTGDARGGPEESVGRVKARRVIAAATDWALSHGGLDQRFRFDVVAVTFGEGDAAPIDRVFEDAFDGDGRPGVW